MPPSSARRGADRPGLRADRRAGPLALRQRRRAARRDHRHQAGAGRRRRRRGRPPAPPVRDPRCRHDRPDAARALRRRPPDRARRAGVRPGRAVRHRRPGLREQRRLPRRSHAGRSRRSATLVAILDAGAYGAAMGSNYNRRPLAPEVLVDDGRWRVIRRPQTRRRHGARSNAPDRLRGARPERQGNPGGAAPRGSSKRPGRRVEALTFPDDATPIGREIRAELASGHRWQPDVMQLLYVANRHERKPTIVSWLEAGAVVICDRYLASSVAYGEAFGLDPAWLVDMQRYLPQPDLTCSSTSRPRPRSPASSRAAIATNATPRCSAGCARATAGRRRPPRTGRCIDGEQPKDVVARRRHRRRPITARATVTARTSAAPAARSTAAHASSVAPVVITSSTSTTTRPAIASIVARCRAAVDQRPRRHPAGASAKAPRTLRRRAPAVSAVWATVARTRRSAATTGGPSAAARSCAWLKPRTRRLARCSGTGTSTSARCQDVAPPGSGRAPPAAAPASDGRRT